MINVSDCIKPLKQLHEGPGIAPARTFKFSDDSKILNPKIPGKNINIINIKRTLTSSHGTVFHVSRNAGKWSCRIDYALKHETSRVSRDKFVKELIRLGAGDYVGLLFERAV